VPLLKWITHGNARSTIMDDYTAISWEARCAEMSKVDVRACAAKETPIEGGILNAKIPPSTSIPAIELPASSPVQATPMHASSSKVDGTLPPGILPGLQGLVSNRVKSRSGRDSNPTETTRNSHESRGLAVVSVG